MDWVIKGIGVVIQTAVRGKTKVAGSVWVSYQRKFDKDRRHGKESQLMTLDIDEKKEERVKAKKQQKVV